MLTVAFPSSITKKPIPLFPSVVIVSPSPKLRSCIRSASFLSSFRLHPLEQGDAAQRLHHVRHGAILRGQVLQSNNV